MTKASTEQQIFQKGSTTYYWSSKFFPKKVREDIFKLYSFVRVVDDFVDSTPTDLDAFFATKALVESCFSDQSAEATQSRVSRQSVRETRLLDSRDLVASADWSHSHFVYDPDVQKAIVKDFFGTATYRNLPVVTQANIILIVNNLIDLSYKYKLDPTWTKAFLYSMELDTKAKSYATMDDTLEYIYGSAEVIGLYMAAILGLPKASLYGAMMQGRAMQYINFIRDIDEDNRLGRLYFPTSELKKYGLKNLSKPTTQAEGANFNSFVAAQVSVYKNWQAEADAAYKYIPKRLRIPVRTATDMYNWTAEQIAKNPILVFEKKLKPTKSRILKSIAANSIR
jgi:15-cis-phytoene synthase